MRGTIVASLLLLGLLAGCGRADGEGDADAQGDGSVTISGDDVIVAELNWTPPVAGIAPGEDAEARERADAALRDDDL